MILFLFTQRQQPGASTNGEKSLQCASSCSHDSSLTTGGWRPDFHTISTWCSYAETLGKWLITKSHEVVVGSQVLLERCGLQAESGDCEFPSRSSVSLSACPCPCVCASRTEVLLSLVAGLLLRGGWLLFNRLDLGRTLTSRYNNGSSSHNFLKRKTRFLVGYSIRVESLSLLLWVSEMSTLVVPGTVCTCTRSLQCPAKWRSRVPSFSPFCFSVSLSTLIIFSSAQTVSLCYFNIPPFPFILGERWPRLLTHCEQCSALLSLQGQPRLWAPQLNKSFQHLRPCMTVKKCLLCQVYICLSLSDAFARVIMFLELMFPLILREKLSVHLTNIVALVLTCIGVGPGMLINGMKSYHVEFAADHLCHHCKWQERDFPSFSPAHCILGGWSFFKKTWRPYRSTFLISASLWSSHKGNKTRKEKHPLTLPSLPLPSSRSSMNGSQKAMRPQTLCLLKTETSPGNLSSPVFPR